MEIEKRDNIKEIVEWIICILIAVVLALIVRHYVFTPTVVSQVSMKPTLQDRERLILNRWSRTVNEELKRGDIITFEAPSVKEVTLAQYNPNSPVAVYNNEPKGLIAKFLYYVLEIEKESYIKRVIGVAGDHVFIEDGKVFLNGQLLKEDYLPSDIYTTREGIFYDLIVPEGYIFAMGDNRSQSKDCRKFGCIPIEKVESKVAFRFWPFNKFGNV